MKKHSKGTELEDSSANLHALAYAARSEFEDIADYVWKSPNLIKTETQLEIEKLRAYFPLTGSPNEDAEAIRLRKTRWFFEARRLGKVFPHVMCHGNFFTSLSVFEAYVLMLCREINKCKILSLDNYSGRGIGKYWKYLSDVPIDLKALAFHEQILAALAIRNCLLHANGVIAWLKNPDEVRQIVRERKYWADYTRNKVAPEDSRDVHIADGPLGEQLVISNDYAHAVLHYLSFFYVDLSKNAQAACFGKCTIELAVRPTYFDLATVSGAPL
jgi:hypothetical protein